MSDPSNHPPAGDEPVAPQTPPAATPPPPPPPPPPGAAPGPWWPHPGYRRYRPVWLAVAVGVLGVLLGCLLGAGVTLVATHLHDGRDRGPAREAPFYGPRHGDRPGFPHRQLPQQPAPTVSPSR